MLGVIAIAVGVLVFAYVRRDPDPELPDLGTVPAFALVDDSGATFSEDALRGHPTIVDFVFTRCDTLCPTLSAKMAMIQERTGDRKGAGIKLMSISVDPEYDTPVKLTEYAQRFKADPTRWRFITGPKDKIKDLVTGPLMNLMDPDERKGQVKHLPFFLLIDGDLHIRGVYDSNDLPRLEDLMHHARFLARTGDGRQYKFGGS
jgi:protein SCO1/2